MLHLSCRIPWHQVWQPFDVMDTLRSLNFGLLIRFRWCWRFAAWTDVPVSDYTSLEGRRGLNGHCRAWQSSKTLPGPVIPDRVLKTCRTGKRETSLTVSGAEKHGVEVLGSIKGNDYALKVVSIPLRLFYWSDFWYSFNTGSNLDLVFTPTISPANQPRSHTRAQPLLA